MVSRCPRGLEGRDLLFEPLAVAEQVLLLLPRLVRRLCSVVSRSLGLFETLPELSALAFQELSRAPGCCLGKLTWICFPSLT